MKTKPKVDVSFSSKASQELKSLKPIFEELCKVHESYTGAEPGGDFSYWYSERPHIGLMAAAAWRRGFTALEEYAAKKRKGQADVMGRCDLYIRTTSRTSFECEAKHRSVNLGDPTGKSAGKVRKSLKQAAKEAAMLREPGQHHLGLCFATLKIKKQKRDELDERCHQLIDRLKPLNGHSECDALVWIHGEALSDGGWRYPGLLLTVKEARN